MNNDEYIKMLKDIVYKLSEMTDGFSFKGTARIWIEELEGVAA